MKKMLFLSGLLVAALLTMTGCGAAEDGTADNNKDADGTSQSPYPNAVAYTLSSEVEGLINETSDHKEEVYKVTHSQSGTYTVYLELLQGTGSRTYATIYDQAGNQITNSSTKKWERSTFEVSTTDSDFYIRINDYENKPSKYKLSIYPSVANGYVPDAEGEKNDVKAMATPITLAQASTEVNGSINITDKTDTEDWYKLPLSDTGTYTVYFHQLAGTATASGDYTSFIVYDELGNQLVRLPYSLSAAGQYSRVTFEAIIAGNYYIRVSRGYDRAVKYKFTVLPSVANGYIQDAEGEKNDVKAMATPITLAQASTEVNGSINITDKTDTEDWYKLPLTATGSYNLNMEILTGRENWRLRFNVYDSYDRVILKVDTSALNKAGESLVLPFNVTVASDYYIKVNAEINLPIKYKFSVTAP